MRKHWAACAFACALIATLPARLAAQTPASVPTPAPTLAPADDPAKWGPYVRLVGKAMMDSNPAVFRVRWRWETPGEVLLEEWCRGSADFDKPSYTTTLRLGAQPGTIMMKTSTMLGKEWVGTLQGDGSVSYVGKGLLKMPFTVRVDEQGMYEMIANKGKYLEKYTPITDSAAPVAVAEASSTPTPTPTPTSTSTSTSAPAAASMSTPVATVPTAPVPSEKPAPVVAKQEPAPPPTPVKLPRRLSEEDMARIHQSVQKSRVRSIEQARQVQLQQQESARQLALQMQAMEAAEAQRQAEEAQADAEFEAERAQKAAAWQQMTQANEQALANSMQRLRNTTAQVQAQQAEAQARQRAQADALAQSERRRQVELIRQANQRQEDEAARLAAQRQQYEQQRADAQAAESARLQQQRSAGSGAGAGHASTDTDANRCVSGADVRENDTTKGNTAAYVSNGCGRPVDVKVCLMTDSGWKCGVTWGLAAQGSWSFSAFHATGAVFVDAKTAGSSRPLASPN